MRENRSPVKEQYKFAVREISLFPMGEDQSPVRIATKTGKKRQCESNDQEKKEKR